MTISRTRKDKKPGNDVNGDEAGQAEGVQDDDSPGDIDRRPRQGDGQSAQDFAAHEFVRLQAAEQDLGDSLRFFLLVGSQKGHRAHHDHEEHQEKEDERDEDGFGLAASPGFPDLARRRVGGEKPERLDRDPGQDPVGPGKIDPGFRQPDLAGLVDELFSQSRTGSTAAVAGMIVQPGGAPLPFGMEDVRSDLQESVQISPRRTRSESSSFCRLKAVSIRIDRFEDIGGLDFLPGLRIEDGGAGSASKASGELPVRRRSDRSRPSACPGVHLALEEQHGDAAAAHPRAAS